MHSACTCCQYAGWVINRPVHSARAVRPHSVPASRPRDIYTFPPPLKSRLKKFPCVCARRAAGLQLAVFTDAGRGRGSAAPVESQRRELPADPIMHGIVARLAEPNQVPTAIPILGEILYGPGMVRHGCRSSPPISGTVLANTAARLQALLPKSAISWVGVGIIKAHKHKKIARTNNVPIRCVIGPGSYSTGPLGY